MRALRILVASLVLASLPLPLHAADPSGFLEPTSQFSLAPLLTQQAFGIIDPAGPANSKAVRRGSEFSLLEVLNDSGFEDGTEEASLRHLQGARDLDAAAARSLPFAHNQPRLVPPFPVALSRAVRRFVDSYLDHSAGLKLCFKRSAPFLSKMASLLERSGVPSDFVFLAFAESEFSYRGAGPWQLSKATARRFGLKVNKYLDERRDPIKSTEAAAEFLTALHDQTDDWRLAVVGWNTGAANLDRFLHLKGADYEQLASTLPHRTRSLLNRFMAVAFLARNAESFGLEQADESDVPAFKHITVPGGTPLRRVARMTDSSMEELRRLNPALLRDRVPPSLQSYELRVPCGEDDAVPTSF